MRTTAKIPLPVEYREEAVTRCDGCGKEQVERNVAYGNTLEWLKQMAMAPDTKGGVEPVDVKDFCPECRPKILRAQEQESKAIKAEKLAAAAETTGIS